MFVDVLLISAFLYGFYVGYNKSIIQTIFYLFAFLLALFTTMRFMPLVDMGIRDGLRVYSPLRPLLAFAITFLIVVLVVKMIGDTAIASLQKRSINPFSQFGAGFLTGFIFLFLMSGMVRFGDKSGIVTPKVKASSKLYRYDSLMIEKTYWATNMLGPLSKDFTDYVKRQIDFRPDSMNINTPPRDSTLIKSH